MEEWFCIAFVLVGTVSRPQLWDIIKTLKNVFFLRVFVPPTRAPYQELNGWRFHYQGWMPDEFDKKIFVRDGTSQQDLKPLNRRGSLDVDVLKKH